MFENPLVSLFVLYATIFLVITAIGTLVNLLDAKRDARQFDPDQIKFAQMMWYFALFALVAQLVAILATIILNIIDKV